MVSTGAGCARQNGAGSAWQTTGSVEMSSVRDIPMLKSASDTYCGLHVLKSDIKVP